MDVLQEKHTLSIDHPVHMMYNNNMKLFFVLCGLFKKNKHNFGDYQPEIRTARSILDVNLGVHTVSTVNPSLYVTKETTKLVCTRNILIPCNTDEPQYRLENRDWMSLDFEQTQITRAGTITLFRFSITLVSALTQLYFHKTIY